MRLIVMCGLLSLAGPIYAAQPAARPAAKPAAQPAAPPATKPAEQSAEHSQADVSQASTSTASRQDAVRSIPLSKMDAAEKAKANSVLSDISVFRRLPVRMIECDPDMYLFLVRHPDIIVNIWQALKISELDVRQVGPNSYRVVDTDGTTATFEYIYRSPELNIVYAEGSYTGTLLQKSFKGRGLIVLKSGYIQESDGRNYITSRMDVFVSVEAGAVELVAKTLHPLVGKVVDNNFTQSVAFVGNLSRTAEVNSAGVQRLSEKLTHVQPELRQQLAKMAEDMAKKAEDRPPRPSESQPLVANRTSSDKKK
jgi:hypothetical protein